MLARKLADAGFFCDVWEERNHVGGHRHTEHDREAGVLVHAQGLHTLHSDDPRIWDFVNRFERLGTYRYFDMDVAIGEGLELGERTTAGVIAGGAQNPSLISP